MIQERVSVMPSFRLAPADRDYSMIRLAQAIVIQAARDATSRDETKKLEAKLWLLEDDQAEEYCLTARVDYMAVVEWIVNGCRAWPGRTRGPKPKSMDLSR